MAAKLKMVPEPVGIDWRKHLEEAHNVRVHPEADKWPMLSEAELRRLGNDILAHGLRNPITLYTPGTTHTDTKEAENWLLDGRSRFESLALVLNEEEFVEHVAAILREGTYKKELQELYDVFSARVFDDNEVKGDVAAYVNSLNLHRRHLEREDYQNRIAALLTEHPERSDRAIAKEAGVSHHTVAKARAKSNGQDAHKPTDRTEVSGRKARGRKPGAAAAASPPKPATTASMASTPAPAASPPTLAPGLKKPVAEARAEVLMQLSALVSLEPDRALSEMVRVLRDARATLAELPKEKRVRDARGFLRALGLTDADLQPIG